MWKKRVSLMLAAALVLTAQPQEARAASAQEAYAGSLLQICAGSVQETCAGLVQTGSAAEWVKSLSIRRTDTRKGAVPDVADTKFTNGTKGSFTWSFQAAGGVLTIKGQKTISGSSLMPDYGETTYQEAPWICQATDMGKGIKKVVFEGLVQAVGAYTFYGYSALEEVDFSQAASLTTLGKYAFAGSGVTEGVRFTGMDRITVIGASCFAGSTVTEISLPGLAVLPAGCFEGCSSLKKATIPGLEEMGDSCFGKCTSLTETPNLSGYQGSTLPKGAFADASALCSVPGLSENTAITALGRECFKNTALREVTLPVKIKTLDDYVFSGTQIEQLPVRTDRVTEVGWSCFGHTNIEETVIPKSITKLDGNLFGGCQRLKRVTIEDGSQLTTMPRSMFSGCTSLEQVVFPEDCKITAIASGAFNGCTALTEFTLPSSVTRVEAEVFKDAASLQQVRFTADALASLDWSAFDGCAVLGQILIYGSSVPVSGQVPRELGADIYVSAQELQESVREALSSHQNYAGDAQRPEEQRKIRIMTEEDKNRKTAQLAIELTENSLAVEEIAAGTVFVPTVIKNTSSRQDIQYCYYTDAACTALFDAQDPYQVPEKVGIYYMRGYLSQDSQWFPAWSNIVSCRVEGLLEEEFFSYHTKTKNLVIKASLDEMLADGEAAEKNFTAAKQQPWAVYEQEIQTAEWADGVTETRIGDYMFANHTSLRQITLPLGITKIGKSAFRYCGKLEELLLPAGLKSLGDEALAGLKQEELILPEGLEIIGASALESAYITEPLRIPSSVTQLGASAFRRFRGSGIVFPEKLSFTGIPDFCFAELDLKEGSGQTEKEGDGQTGNGGSGQTGNDRIFKIPDGITRLGESAFMGAKLTRIEVPASVTRIEKSAFQDCSALKQIALLNKEYTAANVSQATVVINYYTVNSVFANIPDDCMICCDGLTYDLLGDPDSYHYERKLYSADLMEQSLREVMNACDAMEETDYPAQAWAAFEGAYTQIKKETGAAFGSVLDKILVLQKAEERTVAAAAAVLKASTEDAGTLKEEDYTEDSWLDFFYAYDELGAYFETYGLNINKEDLSYLVEVNAEMAGYRRLLEPELKTQQPAPTPKNTGTPAPGGDNTPAPGGTGMPAPGGDNTPAPGQNNTPAPGDPAPGGNNTPAPGGQTPGTPAPDTPTQEPGGGAAITLKKPSLKKVTSTTKKKVSVQWKKVAGASGYEVAYGYKKNMKGAKKAVVKKAAAVSKTIGGLKSKKTCYVRVRAWAKGDGKKVYSSWSAVKKVKVK